MISGVDVMNSLIGSMPPDLRVALMGVSSSTGLAVSGADYYFPSGMINVVHQTLLWN